MGEWQIIIAATLTFSCATILVAYQDYARARMLPIGSLFRGPHPVLMVLSVASCLWAIVFAWLMTAWWSSLIVILGGLTTANVAMWALKERIQFTSFLLLFILIFVDLLILITR